MRYIVQDDNGKKMIMEVVSTIPQLPENWSILGFADNFPEVILEIAADRQVEVDAQTARQFLVDSDWKVMRHRDQVEAGTPTSLTAEEFTQLLAERQAARDLI